VRDGNYAATNYGTNPSLISKNATYSGYTRQIFLKFDISGVSKSYGSVKLRLYGGRYPDAPIIGGTVEDAVGVSVDSWTESTIKWSNKPALGAILSKTAISGQTAVWYEWDVTAFVAARKSAGSSFVTVAIVMDYPPDPDDAYDVFNARESAANKPQLVFGN